MSKLTKKYLKESREDFFDIWGYIGSSNEVKIERLVRNSIKEFDMYRSGRHQMLAYFVVALLNEKGWTQERDAMIKMLGKRKEVAKG